MVFGVSSVSGRGIGTLCRRLFSVWEGVYAVVAVLISGGGIPQRRGGGWGAASRAGRTWVGAHIRHSRYVKRCSTSASMCGIAAGAACAAQRDQRSGDREGHDCSPPRTATVLRQALCFSGHSGASMLSGHWHCRPAPARAETCCAAHLFYF